jgi:hypothetical protein
VAGDAHTAEDAFQATWIVLARKARSVKAGGSLPGWLLAGVAAPHRFAVPGIVSQESA